MRVVLPQKTLADEPLVAGRRQLFAPGGTTVQAHGPQQGVVPKIEGSVHGSHQLFPAAGLAVPHQVQDVAAQLRAAEALVEPELELVQRHLLVPSPDQLDGQLDGALEDQHRHGQAHGVVEPGEAKGGGDQPGGDACGHDDVVAGVHRLGDQGQAAPAQADEALDQPEQGTDPG